MCSTNVNDDREVYNSAIGGWSGFIFQGLCALYHCLRLIKEDKEVCKDYKLNLDSYEDFSIFDGQEKLISLHQCKNENVKKKYTEEFNKMKRKRDACGNSSCLLYFHSSQNNRITDPDIIAYDFKPGITYCKPKDLIDYIEKIIENITQADIPVCKKKTSVLYKLIDDKVMDIHQKFLNREGQLRDIARREFIPFCKIINELEKNETITSFEKKDFISYVKSKMKIDLIEQLDDEDNPDCKILINDFIAQIQSVSDEIFYDFLKRVHLRHDFSCRNLNLLIDVANDYAHSHLYNVLAGTSKLNSDLNWTDCNQKETPSALGTGKKIGTLCKEIYENSTNLDLLYEYDWIVGDVDYKVNNIASEPRCTKIKDNDPDNIFNKKNIGILRIEDKKNENY